MRLQTYLNELFDTKVNIKVDWQDTSSLRYIFTINDMEYFFTADTYKQKEAWEIWFALKGVEGGSGIMNTGKATQVFAAVSKCMDMFIKKVKPDAFYFSANEPSRVKLYKRFSKLLTRKYKNYEVKNYKDQHGNNEFLFMKD
jgi:hypothetical protein